MDFHFDSKVFSVEKFYSYPTSVVYRIANYNEQDLNKHCGDKNVKKFFDEILKYANEKTGKNLMDNKIAFKIRFKDTDSVLYVGYKDNIWSIGLSLHPYMNAATIINID